MGESIRWWTVKESSSSSSSSSRDENEERRNEEGETIYVGKENRLLREFDFVPGFNTDITPLPEYLVYNAASLQHTREIYDVIRVIVET